MIRVGIAGADSPMAGELIRILVNHPDVELVSLCAPGRKDIRVDSVHHGLVGECELLFSEYLNPANLDVVFLDAHSALAAHFRQKEIPEEGLKVIDMSHGPVPEDNRETVYALSEINRKKLVRGAMRAVVPRSLPAMALIALLPLAEHMMLSGQINLVIAAPDDLLVDFKLEMAKREVDYWLRVLQPSFTGNVTFEEGEPSTNSRGMRLIAELPVNTDPDMVKDMYSQRFADHTLTYTGDVPADFKQVEGTDKCLVNLSMKTPGKLHIEAVADCRMRGGAGDAVQAMNLMFGLIETTGLRLKAHVY